VKKAVNNYTPAQFATLKKLLIELKTRYPKAVIQGHRDFPKVAKSCPCFSVKDWLKAEKI
jgi:N-acetylmuramoyl-L-alanine amidase